MSKRNWIIPLKEARLKVVIPKGRMYHNVAGLLNDAGFGLGTDKRLYRPFVSYPDVEVKIMKPQNIPKLIELGSHDIGFTGYDWIVETGADVVELMDLKFDPVKIVAAVHENLLNEDLRKRKIVVASEYERIAKSFLDKEGFEYIFLKTYGATEVFPPDDADLIIDNTQTEKTLKEHNLHVISTIFESSTRFIGNKETLGEPLKRKKIQELKMLFQSVLDARERVMLEMNVPKDKLVKIINLLPCMRAPTVAPLYGGQGYAVKVAVKKGEVAKLLPLIKKLGATDILEFEIKKVAI